MSVKDPKFKWKKQSFDEDCETIDCPECDDYKDFCMEPTGSYVLIRINQDEDVIEVAICTKDHRIRKIFRGKTPQQIYHKIFQVEKSQDREWFTEKDHIAYLGKELNKAEEALKKGNDSYIQE